MLASSFTRDKDTYHVVVDIFVVVLANVILILLGLINNNELLLNNLNKLDFRRHLRIGQNLGLELSDLDLGDLSSVQVSGLVDDPSLDNFFLRENLVLESRVQTRCFSSQQSLDQVGMNTYRRRQGKQGPR